MLRPIALRLQPGQDLKAELDNLVQSSSIEAACILTCAGSLTKAVLRYANQEQAIELDGHFEIVSLTGTLSKHGSHYHIAIADGCGRTIGAHLLEGCRVSCWQSPIIAADHACAYRNDSGCSAFQRVRFSGKLHETIFCPVPPGSAACFWFSR